MKNKYQTIGDITLIHLSNCDEHVIIDTEDIPLIADYKWRMNKVTGCVVASKSQAGGAAKGNVYMHKLVMETVPAPLRVSMSNKLDLRKSQLRIATNRQLTMKQQNPRSASGYRYIYRSGIYWQLSRKVNGVDVYGGYSADINDLLPKQRQWEQERLQAIRNLKVN